MTVPTTPDSGDTSARTHNPLGRMYVHLDRAGDVGGQHLEEAARLAVCSLAIDIRRILQVLESQRWTQ